ncbi:MAG: hypothetical protein C4570_07165 [Ammonifex sp.]|nr:MAG: hypothetical protein C4570_07165 [Ammonifex sp.]
MRVKLRSDFWDYYDHWFDAVADVTFERFSRGGVNRREMFEFLESIDLRVPLYGKPREIFDRLGDFFRRRPQLVEVVVYLDERAHQGEGKIKVLLPEALEKYPDYLALQYIPATPSGNGVSLRYLQVGDKIFWLKYRSRNNWRSNCGDVEIRVLGQEKDGYHPKIEHPLFAIDFVPTDDTLYAVDFNIAPQIRGTGVENLVPAKKAAEAIKKALFRERNDAE